VQMSTREAGKHVGKQLGSTGIEVNNGGNRFVGDGQHHPQILQNCPVEEILHADG